MAGAPDRDRGAVVLGLAVAAAGLAADQVTKRLAEQLLVPGQFVEVLGGWFGWQLTFNRGGAFGLPAPSWVFLVVTVLVVVIVVRNLPHSTSRTQAAAFGLLLAGALGNAADRLLGSAPLLRPPFFAGSVVDFVALELPLIGSWPRFNVADASLFCAFLLLVVTVALDGPAAGVGAPGPGRERSPTATGGGG